MLCLQRKETSWTRDRGDRGTECRRCFAQSGAQRKVLKCALSTFAGVELYCELQERRGAPAPYPPGDYFAAGRDPRQTSASGPAEEGRDAHTSDVGLPPVETASPCLLTRPAPACMAHGGGLGGAGLWSIPRGSQGAVWEEGPGH